MIHKICSDTSQTVETSVKLNDVVNLSVVIHGHPIILVQESAKLSQIATESLGEFDGTGVVILMQQLEHPVKEDS